MWYAYLATLSCAPAALPPNDDCAGATAIGDSAFALVVVDPIAACAPLFGSLTLVALSLAPLSLPLAGFGCGAGAGEVLVSPVPFLQLLGPVAWLPGGATHPAPVPFDLALSGGALFAQGFWLDLVGPTAPGALTNRLDLVLGL